ncbi:peptidase [Mucilaginibacter sp. SP1R1]|uniref:carboxylesterase family protein n=1 Tax=Mucilaginibacter sp. SP1R1 TaxID=2723091 RepID=UPI0016070152|nr:peptidase [Mucilaginibacter sp. SP1R1]MBB6150328.1 hypothetical protein [Mucilaginibacter sp. SP1R1]
MNKSLYNLAILLLGMTVACNLLQSFLRFQFGVQMFTQPSFSIWFLSVNLVAIITSGLLLKYYYHQKYWIAFYTAIISIIANISFAVVIYIILTSRQLGNYYQPLLITTLITGIIYAGGLIFSDAGKKLWLKLTGVYVFVFGLILLSIVIWSIHGQPVQPGSTAEKIGLYASLMAGLAPLLFIMQFLIEMRLLKPENGDAPVNKSLETILIVVGLFVFISTLILGVTLTSENYSSRYWGERNFENTKQLARLFETRNFVNSKGDTLTYHLLKPLNFDPTKKYPLVVCLPYGGQPGTDKIRQMEGAAAAEILSADVNRKKYPAFIFIPNCPAGSGWGGIPNYPSVDTLVYKAISALDAEPGIDVKRRYVTGISRGGYGSWHFICTRPDLFAAAIPVCGGDDPKLAPKIVDVAVWAFHGARDLNVPVSGSRDMISAMKKAGGNPKYTEYPNEGHNIWNLVSNTPGLFDWLFAQKKE